MPKACWVLAFILFPALALPASAREPGKGQKAKPRAQAFHIGAGNPALSGIGRRSRAAEPGTLNQIRGTQFPTGAIVLPQASGGSGIVGSMPLVGSLEAGVGLFSVTGAEVKERRLSRMDPMADVQPRRSRVAAVGLRLAF